MKKDDLVGKKFNLLTVISQIASIYYGGQIKTNWACICDCGQFTSATSQDLKRTNKRSCGCLNSRKKSALDTGFNRVLNGYSCSARKKGVAMELQRNETVFIMSQNCFYCGAAPSSKSTSFNKTLKITDVFVYNGIDRINPNLGYTLDNCVTCCSVCNFSKNNYSLEEFIDWVRKAYNHIKPPKIQD